MNVEGIMEAIVHLSGPERQQLAEWFDELQEDEWDRQTERDLSAGGRGAHLLEQVDSQIEACAFTSLEEGLQRRRAQRAKE